MTEKPAASGSIWNVNSWHWEMKNYTVVAKKLVEEKFLSMQLKDGDVTVTTTKVKFPQAEVIVPSFRLKSTFARGSSILSMSSRWMCSLEVLRE